MEIYIETNRVVLRELRMSDVQGIFELDSDPEVHRYLGNRPIQSLQEAVAIIQYVRNQYQEDGIGRWAIEDKATGEFIGWAGIKYEKMVRKDMPYYDLGYRLKKDFWGRGIATEVALESLRYGFEMMKLKVIYAGAHIDNVASNKVLRKVGFRFIEVFEYDQAAHNWYRYDRADWLRL